MATLCCLHGRSANWRPCVSLHMPAAACLRGFRRRVHEAREASADPRARRRSYTNCSELMKRPKIRLFMKTSGKTPSMRPFERVIK